MQILNETLDGISMGNKSSFQNLTVTPLNTVLLREPDYLTLDEALAFGAACVTEVSGGGHVPELRFVNDLTRRFCCLMARSWSVPSRTGSSN